MLGACEWMHSNIGGVNWHSRAIEIAKENGELCDHTTLFNIKIQPEVNLRKQDVKFFVWCGVCGKPYEKRYDATEKKLTEEFKKILRKKNERT